MPDLDLSAFGWTPELAQSFSAHAAEGLVPARISAQHRGRYVVFSEAGERSAEASGRLRHGGGGFPAVGDWVGVQGASDPVLIEAVLPRTSAFVRSGGDPTRRDSAAGSEVVAANADLVFVVTAAGQDFNLRRLERYLAAGWASGAQPVVVLTKADLSPDPPALVRLIEAAAPGAPVVAVSNKSGEGVDQVRALIAPGRTACLLGSSGVGKSSLVNRLLGASRQAVAEVRADGRGRHTTTHRELILLEGGGLVLDTPGMRLITPPDDEGMLTAFADIEALAQACRFKDCTHSGEPDCAVWVAVRAGALSQERLEGMQKLKRELAHLDRREDKALESQHRKRWKKVHRSVKTRMREKQSGLD